MAPRLLPAAVPMLASRFRPETIFRGNFRAAGSDDGNGKILEWEGIGGHFGVATGVRVDVWFERVPEELGLCLGLSLVQRMRFEEKEKALMSIDRSIERGR